jgi:hypothetical protein
MDISGGLPAVLIKMLVASDPGLIRLFPARPSAWPSGTIEGVLCRGQIEIKRLVWDGRTIQVTLRSAKPQDISLYAPGEILTAAVRKGEAAIRSLDDARGRKLSLPAGQDVLVAIELR